MDRSIFTSSHVQCMLQAQAERAFWMAKDQLLRHEMFDLNAACARLRHQDQRTSFCQDVTTDADKFEKVIVPLDHRINKVTDKECDSEHSPCYTCRSPTPISYGVSHSNAVMSAHQEYKHNGVDCATRAT